MYSSSPSALPPAGATSYVHSAVRMDSGRAHRLAWPTLRIARVTSTGVPVAPDRNLALELVRVTEAAALAAGRWVGRGDKIAADQAAVDGMRAVLDTVSMAGVVVIGEGEKDEAPMLYNGEEVGN